MKATITTHLLWPISPNLLTISVVSEIAQTIENIDQIRKINPSSFISNSKKKLPI